MADSLVRRGSWSAAISPATLPSGASSPLALPPRQCDLAKSRSRDSGARAASLLRSIPSRDVRRAAAAPVARVTCVFGGNKRDAARKALESALGEKKDVFNKWDEEIKKREAGGGGGKGRGRGWGGDGRGDGEGDSGGENWGGNKKSEALQVVYAFAGLASVYLILTKGSTMMAFVLNSILWVSRGFKPRAKPRYAPVTSEDDEDAESHVRKKWGSDD